MPNLAKAEPNLTLPDPTRHYRTRPNPTLPHNKFISHSSPNLTMPCPTRPCLTLKIH